MAYILMTVIGILAIANSLLLQRLTYLQRRVNHILTDLKALDDKINSRLYRRRTVSKAKRGNNSR